jgi:NlpC/P60 family putative phage cell wall peptidase
MSDTQELRARAVQAARGWIGTPWAHRASLRGAGADCLGLVRGVWRALYGRQAAPPPVYADDWAAGGDANLLEAALARHLGPVTLDEAQPGDVMLFRLMGSVASHCGVLSREGRMIHAYATRGVVETPLGPWWMRRRVAAFRFPEIEEG